MAKYMRDVPHQKIKAGEKHICHECFHYAVCMGRVNRPCIECDNYVPAADVRVNVKGEWVTHTRKDSDIFDCYVCSNCGNGDIAQHHFCMWCGAEMVVRENTNTKGLN